MIDSPSHRGSSQLPVRPGALSWSVVLGRVCQLCTGHDTDEHVFGVLADAETSCWRVRREHPGRARRRHRH